MERSGVFCFFGLRQIFKSDASQSFCERRWNSQGSVDRFNKCPLFTEDQALALCHREILKCFLI
jgi:hypothetical protein